MKKLKFSGILAACGMFLTSWVHGYPPYTVQWECLLHDPYHTGLSSLTGDLSFVDTLWSYRLDSYPRGFVTADIDGDGDIDVIVSGDSKTYAIQGDNGVSLWSNPNPHGEVPAIGDIDKDGKLELVNCNNGSQNPAVYALNAEDGSLFWSGTGGGLNDFYFCSPTLGDIDNDDTLEVVVGNQATRTIYALDGEDGFKLWSFTGATIFRTGVALGDVDGDNKLEVVCGSTNTNKVYALNGEDGSQLWERTILGNVNYYCNTVLGKIKDATIDVLIGASNAKMYALNGENGSELWSYNVGLPINSSPVIGDIDKDGKLEAVFSRGRDLMHAVNCDVGSTLWTALDLPNVFFSLPALADIDGDDTLEVVVGASNNKVYALNGEDGSILWTYELPDAADCAAPVFGDVDNDGKLEIIVGCKNYYVYVLDKKVAIEEELGSFKAFLISESNPFSHYTRITYGLPRDTKVDISIYNLVGQKVATLVNEYQTRGRYTVDWDGRTNTGIINGVYFCKLTTSDGETLIKKLTLIK